MKEIKILKIEETFEETDMYDLEVEDNHNFILENKLITHNSGKTCFSFWLAEKIHAMFPYKRIAYVGVIIRKGLLPDWCSNYEDVNKVPDDSFVIIDEMAVNYNAREYQSKKNIQLGQLMAIARHHNLSVLLIAQDPRQAEVNAWRLRDLIIYKRSNTYDLPDREGAAAGKIIQFWRYVKQWLKPTKQEQALLEDPGNGKVMLFKYDIPECWSEELSKAFSIVRFNIDVEPEEVKPKPKVYKTLGGIS
jgi:hypothetical protein